MNNLDYLYNANDARKVFGKNRHVDKQLGFTVLEGATVLPHKHLYVNGNRTLGLGGLVDRRGEFIKSSFIFRGRGAAYTPTEDVQQSSATVVYLGIFFPVWGHCLSDNLRRLWFLKSDAFKKYFKDCTPVYISWNNGAERLGLERQENFRRLLAALDIDISRLQAVDRPTKFANVILPDESFFADGDERFFTNEYIDTIDRARNFALKNRTPSAEKVYFFYGRNQVGEERLAQYFSAKGYAIVQPERLTLEAQLNILINAKSFASTLGSCAHNSIFLRDGTDVILIPRSPFKFSWHNQQIFDGIRNANVHYVDSSLSIFNHIIGPYCFVLSRELKNFFGDDFGGYTVDDLKTFAQYIKTYAGHGIDPDAENYYGATLTEFLTQLKRRPDLTAAYGVNLS